MQTVTEQLVEALDRLFEEEAPSFCGADRAPSVAHGDCPWCAAGEAIVRARADPEALLRENGEAVRRLGNELMAKRDRRTVSFPDLSCLLVKQKGDRMMAEKKCIGFPKGPCSGVPNRNPYWCDECDEKRIDHITARFAALSPKTGTPT